MSQIKIYCARGAALLQNKKEAIDCAGWELQSAFSIFPVYRYVTERRFFMSYIPPEAVAKAKEMDLLTYLKNYEPQELVHFGGNTWCTRTHDSLKISNGKWHWFSRKIGGKTALDYLIKVQGLSFTDAVEKILGQAAASPPVLLPASKVNQPKTLLLPALSPNCSQVLAYLAGRGIHPGILNECIRRKLLFETRQYHNAMFVGYDQAGRIRYAALRGITGNYKGEATGSDKRYSFSIVENPNATSVHLFESAIDLLSYATLLKMKGQWGIPVNSNGFAATRRQEALLSLAGVFQTKRADVIPLALNRFLEEYPSIQTVHLHLDNDAVGRNAARNILNGLKDRYTVLDEPPPYGKDVNEMLQMRLRSCCQRTAYAR